MQHIPPFFYRRFRLIVATLLGIIVALLLPSDSLLITRALIGWNVAVWSYLVFMAWLITRTQHVRVQRIAQEEDKSAVVILAILSIAAIISILAIVLELSTAKELPTTSRLLHYAFTAITVFGSWFLVGVIYTFHYAHMFYRAPSDKRPLQFPDNEQHPDYWDFLYFSFTISVAAQTSDVSIHSRAMRKTVFAQSILSFLFNAAIIGLSINIAAGLMGA